MTRKVFDILPPESSKPSHPEEVISAKKPPRLPKTIKVKNKKAVWALIPLALIIVAILGIRLPRAGVEIWPGTETLVFTTEFTVDTKATKPDFVDNIITGQVVEAEGSASESFLSSGETQKKAEGVIRLYNAYTSKSENWLAGTRFVSADGKLFKSKNKIAVPGAEIKNDKLVPSYVDVPVIAAEEGEEYNIGPSHFSIFVFRGTPRYTKFYGESSESITGGGSSPQVTEQDLQTAEDTLTQKAKEVVRRNLEGGIPEGFVFLPDVLETEILEQFSLARAGDKKEEFSFQVVAKGNTILLKKDDAENLVKQFILDKMPEQKLMYKPSLTIDYTPQVIDLEAGRVIISVDFSVKIYPEVDLSLLKKGLTGKSLNEARIFLENQSSVISAKIQLWPFWVKSVPRDLNKIEIQYPLIVD